MSKYRYKYKTIDVWNHVFGLRTEAYDYAGRLMRKSACGDPHSSYHPTLDHIRPLSDGGCDVLDNIVICHRDTNREKANHFPHWKANGSSFHAERVVGSRVAYTIINDAPKGGNFNYVNPFFRLDVYKRQLYKL